MTKWPVHKRNAQNDTKARTTPRRNRHSEKKTGRITGTPAAGGVHRVCS